MERYLPYAALLLLFAYSSLAQEVLVRTEARMVTGQSVQSAIQFLDLDAQTILSDATTLPGASVTGPGLFVPGAGILFSSGGASHAPIGGGIPERSYIVAGPLGIWDPYVSPLFETNPGDYAHAAALLPATAPWSRAVAVLVRSVATGRVDFYSLGGGDSPLSLSITRSASLPGPPLRAIALPNKRGLAVLTQVSLTSEPLLHRIDLEGSVAKTIALHEEGHFGASPSALALSVDQNFLLVLTSGYDLDRPSGSSQSWLHVFHSDSLERVGSPYPILGAANLATPALHPGPEGICWVATSARAAEFAYVQGLTVAGSGLESIANHTFYAQPIHLAIAAEGPLMASSSGAEVHFWRDFEPDGKPVVFSAPIGALVWSNEGLLVGEGGRIHRINPESRAREKSIQLQTGFVAEIFPRDSPSRRIPENAPRAPLRSKVSTPLPLTVTFHAEALLNEVKTIRIEDAGAAFSKWRAEYDEQAMPWLGLYPEEGGFPENLSLIVFPAYHALAQSQEMSGRLTLHFEAPEDQGRGRTQKREIEIRVAPRVNEVQRILWLEKVQNAGLSMRDPAHPRRFSALLELLAAPPHHFSHQVATGPVIEPLEEYVLVVLDGDAPDYGAVTRQALLDYVTTGGSLLILGGYNPEAEPDSASRWLDPVGIRMDAATPISGIFQTNSDHELARDWGKFNIDMGCAIVTDKLAVVTVRGPSENGLAIFAHAFYGLGRVAVLASPTPLQNRSLQDQPHRRFAATLFRWLARARHEIFDNDQDGLPNTTEDGNGNRIVDPGETSWYSADTDGDGIRDDLEDINRNGWVEEGETSPVIPDTDGDGIFDGADVTPLPPSGAPLITTVAMNSPGVPVQGPAEGGTSVTIHGRNFTHQTEVWFGNRRSPRVRRIDATQLLAETPSHESSEGGVVEVRVVTYPDGEESTLPVGYAYTPTTTVEIKLANVEYGPTLAHIQPRVYEGIIKLNVESEASSLIGEVSLTLAVDPPGALYYIGFLPTKDTERSRRTLSLSEVEPGLWRVDISAPKFPGPIEALGALRWRAGLKPDEYNLSFLIDRLIVTSAMNGAPLDAHAGSIRIPLRTRETP